MQKYLATDLDGTLFFPKDPINYVCKENLETLKHFSKTIIVSGRPARFIKDVCKEINISETFIACNGASIYVDSNQVFVSYIDNKLILEIIEYCKSINRPFSILLFDDIGTIYSVNDDNDRALKQELVDFQSSPKLTEITNKDEKIINELLKKTNSFIKINIRVNLEDKDECYEFISKNFSNLETLNCRRFIEITNKDINKGSSLKRLAKIMNIKENDIYVIGDDSNDLPMLTTFKNSFLVSNNNNITLHNKVNHVLNSFSELKDFLKEE